MVARKIQDFAVSQGGFLYVIDVNGRVWGRGFNYALGAGNGVIGTTPTGNNTTTYAMCTGGSPDANCGTPPGAVGSSSGNWIKKTDGASESYGETGFDHVFVAAQSACALKAGSAYCWGSNQGV